MLTNSDRVVLRRAVARHAALTALAAVLISLLVTAGIALFARQDAYRTAEQVARQVTAAVIVPLSHHDFTLPQGPTRDELRAELAPFLTSGMVLRMKVWTLRGDEARIAYSDEPRVEGRVSRLDPETAARLSAGEAVVRTVPDDTEHRFEESAAGSLLEVFVGFRDAGGRVTLLEVYVPTDVVGTARRTAGAVLPMVLAGLALLAVATLPLAVALARRMERERAEQRAIRRYGLAAADASRQELARRLHDGVIPDLAGASLLLEAVRTGEAGAGSPTSRRLIDRAHDLLTGEMRQLRDLLTDLVPISLSGEGLAAALRMLGARLRAGDPAAAPEVEIEVALDREPPHDSAVVLYRVAGELLRNVFRHARADHVRVRVRSVPGGALELTVADDGTGFDPDRAPRHGHVGLRLVRRVIEDHAGHLDILSTPGAGTTVTATVRPDLAPWRPPAEDEPPAATAPWSGGSPRRRGRRCRPGSPPGPGWPWW